MSSKWPVRCATTWAEARARFRALEIALWDLIGKAAGQPLYKLWGAAKDRVPAYASMIQLSTPEESVRMAVQLKSQGWKAIKLRAHYQTLKEDVRLVEAVRKAVGDDMEIMVDANQAQSFGTWQPGVMWDFRRALRDRAGTRAFELPTGWKNRGCATPSMNWPS